MRINKIGFHIMVADEATDAAAPRLHASAPSYDAACTKQAVLVLSGRGHHRVDAWRMIQRRAAGLGMQIRIGCHTFRATGITAYLEAGGTLENAQAMAAHESPRTTKLYDRTGDEITLDEVERVSIYSKCAGDRRLSARPRFGGGEPQGGGEGAVSIARRRIIQSRSLLLPGQKRKTCATSVSCGLKVELSRSSRILLE